MYFLKNLKNNLLGLITIILLVLSACQSDNDKAPNVSHINLAIKVQRFEQDLFKLDSNNMTQELQQLQQKHSMFMEIFPNLISDPNASNVSPEQLFKGFITYPQLRKLYDTCQVVHKNTAELDKEFTQTFKFVKYYFPKRPTPQVVTFISEYGYSAFTYGDSLLAIGLDAFLGENHIGYQNSNIPRYVLRSMNKTHLVAKAMEAYVNDMAEENLQGKRLIDVMISNGKKLYVLDKLLPYTPDSVKLAYTQTQVEWCNKNEADLWAFLLSEDMLYSVKNADWVKLVNPSPTGTPKMPAESPGRAGNWLGMQIVKAYMKRYPNTSMDELLANKDAQAILDKAKYKPKRK
jgi:hypothetical protein